MTNTKTNTGYRGPRHPGQGTLEYTMMGVLVLVICVGGLEILTGSLSSAWQILHTEMQQKQVSEVAITDPKFTPSGSPTGAGLKFVTLKGTVITLPSTVNNMEKSIETLGANGTTAVLVKSLEELIKQLVENRELNRTQSQSLIYLANSGHALAKMHKLTEDAIANTSTIEEYRFVIESIPALVDLTEEGYHMHNIGCYYPHELDPLQPNAELQLFGVTGDFLRAYQKAVSSGALDDPAVRLVVEALTRKISNLSTVASHTFESLAHNEISHSEVSGFIAENIAKTHDSSAQICTTGNGQDSGTQCASGG
ncbi:hypothetical protein [Vampirovibrio chlorellavorus]|uniref:hypothetical protein n=1 Tax=Vampirovibrio chlorellavorus TaxID=758823 RepID=UPI0026EDEEBF|nr:hypothetical protein [Vampirovibrio chlorellavorus]